MSSSSQPNRRRKTSVAAADLYFPVDCWECIITFLKDDNRCLESLSLVSKELHTITNSLRFSLTICDQTIPFLPFLYRRFTNLTSLNLSRLSSSLSNLNRLLRQISRFRLKLTSLNLSNQEGIPTNGLLAFSKKITTLTSLICSHMRCIYRTEIFLIANCFPLLEVLDISDPVSFKDNQEVENLSFTLFKLRKVNLSGLDGIAKLLFHLSKNCPLLEEVILLRYYDLAFDGGGVASALCEAPRLTSLSFSTGFGLAYGESYITSQFIASIVSLKYLTSLDLLCSKISDELLSSIANEGLPLMRLVLQNCARYSYSGIFDLLSKCRHIRHLDLQGAVFLTDKHVVDLSLFLGDLVYINLTRCSLLTISAFFALINSCPSLSDIKMEYTGKNSLENSESLMDFTRPQLKYLRLAGNPWLTDENITMLASISPNLQLLDLTNCPCIEEGISQVLRMCCNIRRLNLSYCSKVKLLEMNFEVPKLEVLNLSYTNVDNETLYVISTSCRGLLQLSLEGCTKVTEMGLKQMLENFRATQIEACVSIVF
ncbi:F-box protein At-B-like [Trifolium pratense]|uniref:F-box protein At-B-like n=1 Tax=Trifolium pratense TaxID=57577 RepID=UPI001E697F3E|nr:F-box protein At-B-like [Trifolium pratense]